MKNNIIFSKEQLLVYKTGDNNPLFGNANCDLDLNILSETSINHLDNNNSNFNAFFNFSFSKFKENIKPGISVGFLNLALCISIPVASNCNPSMGILAGIISGIFSGGLAGSKYNVLGPSGTVSGVVAAFVLKYGIEMVPFVTIASSIISFILFFFKIHEEITLIPSSINLGFKLGVAFLLAFGQIKPALGFSYAKNELDFSFYTSNFTSINLITATTFLVFTCLLTYLTKSFPKIPWIIVSTLLGILIGLMGLGIETIETKYGNVKFQAYNFAYLNKENYYTVLTINFWIDAFFVCLVYVIETLLTAKILDEMSNSDCKYNKKSEMYCVSISNLVVGLLGGMPLSAALGRGALNLKSEATDKISSLICGLVLVIVGLFFFPYFKYLPLSIIAAQLWSIAILMIDFNELSILLRENTARFIFVILIGVIFIARDPVQGVAFGMFVSYLSFIRKTSKPKFEIVQKEDLLFFKMTKQLNSTKFYIYRIIGILDENNIDFHKKQILNMLPNGKNTNDWRLVLDMRYSLINSYDVYMAIFCLVEKLRKNNDFFFDYTKDVQRPIHLIGGVKLEELENSEAIDISSYFHRYYIYLE